MELTTRTYKGGLTDRESFLVSTLAREDKAIFGIEDVRAVIGEHAKKVMHSLIRKKWVLPLKRGMYALVPLDVGVRGADSFVIHNLVIGSLLVEPYYIGFWSALNYHGLTDQIPRTTFVVTTKAKKSLDILGSRYYFVKLTDRKFFGFSEHEIDSIKVNISTPEKTIVDCLDHPEHSGGIDEIARSIFFSYRDLDMSSVKEHALKMGNLAILKRLGYILEVTGLLPSFGFLFEGIELTRGYSSLDALSARKGRYNSKWKLLINSEINREGWMY
jgi:predicted transcriptional regulator of viral defense system